MKVESTESKDNKIGNRKKPLTIEQIIESNSLREEGTLEEISNLIKKEISPLQLPEKTSFDSLEKIVKEIIYPIYNYKNKKDEYKNEYFKSEQAELTFYLVELDRKEKVKQLKKFGYNDMFYNDKDLVKKWYKKMSKLVHPDINNLKKSNEAFDQLKKLVSDFNVEFEDTEFDLKERTEGGKQND